MFKDILNNCKRSATAGCSFSSVAVAPVDTALRIPFIFC